MHYVKRQRTITAQTTAAVQNSVFFALHNSARKRLLPNHERPRLRAQRVVTRRVLFFSNTCRNPWTLQRLSQTFSWCLHSKTETSPGNCFPSVIDWRLSTQARLHTQDSAPARPKSSSPHSEGFSFLQRDDKAHNSGDQNIKTRIMECPTTQWWAAVIMLTIVGVGCNMTYIFPVSTTTEGLQMFALISTILCYFMVLVLVIGGIVGSIRKNKLTKKTAASSTEASDMYAAL